MDFGLRTLSVLCHLRRNVSKFHVGVLRHPLEDMERLCLGNVLAFDDDPKRNPSRDNGWRMGGGVQSSEPTRWKT
jgi:hypothetical protein